MQAILGFSAVAAVLTIIPGTDTMLVLRSALVRGRRYAFAAAVGVNVGSLIWGMAAAVGAAALLATSQFAYQLVSIAGGLYIAYLGISMIVKSFRKEPLTL